MEINAKIYIAGSHGMVGTSIIKELARRGFENIITRTSAQLDLRDQRSVSDFFIAEKPDYVFLAAAKVGGILANDTFKAEFLYDNLMIQSNVIHNSYVHKVKKLLFLGSSCIYPKHAPQPLKEEYLLTGTLEPTNEAYAIAKIVGIKMCDAYRSQYGCNFISVMPANLYGNNDNYDLKTSHVIPALIRKFHEAKMQGSSRVIVWGSGSPMREFLHVNDLASACLYLMENFNEAGFVNVGTGKDITIKDLAVLIREIVGYHGTIEFDATKPDGTRRKLLDVSRLHQIGWRHKIELSEGLKDLYKIFVEDYEGKLSIRNYH